MSRATKGGHYKLRGQPMRRYVSAQWRFEQKEHAEDLVKLNGERAGAPSAECEATELNNIGRSKARQAGPD